MYYIRQNKYCNVGVGLEALELDVIIRGVFVVLNAIMIELFGNVHVILMDYIRCNKCDFEV